MSNELSDIASLFSDDAEEKSPTETPKKATPQHAPKSESSFTLVSRGSGPLRERYRPQKLEELAPTCSVTQLRNLVDNPNASKVFLFEGKTGTGKTTCARILAKASVCLSDNPLEKPCLKCESCENFEHNFEITEINVADRRKIDDVRNLVDLMRYRPGLGGCSKKIIILDEMHQYTPEAQQALLTQLEDPPSYLLVFLCTTDAHTLNPMLVDRATRINFKRLGGAASAEIINQVCNIEGVSPSDEIKESFYRRSGGSVRSLLNQIQSFIEGGYDPRGTDEDEETAGIKAIATAILKADFADLVVALRKVEIKKDPEGSCSSLASYFRGIVISVNNDNIPRNDLDRAVQLTNVLVRLLGPLTGNSSVDRYNDFVSRCVRALNVMSSK